MRMGRHYPDILAAFRRIDLKKITLPPDHGSQGDESAEGRWTSWSSWN